MLTPEDLDDGDDDGGKVSGQRKARDPCRLSLVKGFLERNSDFGTWR